MTISEIQSDIEAIAGNAALFDEANFDSRTEALDDLAFHVIDRLTGLLQTKGPLPELITLKAYAEQVRYQLEAIDSALFQQLRATIRQGGFSGPAFLKLITLYVGRDLHDRQTQPIIGYDNLDVFVNGLFPVQIFPLTIGERDPEMVFYQKTPARIIFELVAKAQPTDDAVFYDIGSGLGHVPILVNLLSGATARGVEIEPDYCTYATACATDLNRSRVAFIQADARAVDYSDGTVFFLYTPFKGRILQEVLELLRKVARSKPITLFTYGPCTLPIAQQNWLHSVDKEPNDIDKLAEFRSLPGRG